ncbi:MAG: alpha/beta hydrolase-fold protein [Thermoflexales bacterium]|nr:alpha/beta hydrolase-fold protein [Thermoflexales bacterium]
MTTPKPLPYREWRSGLVSGTLEVFPDVYSPQLGNRRPVVVYLPPSYARAPERRYPVIYFHDGQNLFDPATSYIGIEWGVDETLEALSKEGVEAIAVGIWNTEQRMSEYSPFPNWFKGRGEAYLDFIVHTVKPMIERVYRVMPGREHTVLFGSSMGGLISLYGFITRPQVFGRVGAMSPAFWVGNGMMHALVRERPFVPGRVYIDHGTREYNPHRMRDVLLEKGYRLGEDFTYVSERGGEHDEAAWARRLPNALRFLLSGLCAEARAPGQQRHPAPRWQ